MHLQMANLQDLARKVKELDERVKKLEVANASPANKRNTKLMDALYKNALELVIRHNKASVIFLQRKLLIDFPRAQQIMRELEKNGVIGPNEGVRPRKILVKGPTQDL